MRILIVAPFFPPHNAIGALRPYSWAKYWSRAGHDVTVLTTCKPDDEARPEGRYQVIEAGGGLDTTLRRMWRRWRDNWSDAPSSSRTRVVSKRTGFLHRLIQALLLRGIGNSERMPGLLDFWFFSACWAVKGRQWDVVVSTYSPYITMAIAYRLRRQQIAARWVADYRDLWTGNQVYTGLPLFRGIERWLEHRFLSTADCVTTVSDGLRTELEKVTVGQRVQVVTNGIDFDDLDSLESTSIFPPDGKFRLVYTGTVYPGLRDPEPLFRGLADLFARNPEFRDQVEVIFVGGRPAGVTEAAVRHGVGDVVSYRGMVPRHDALRMQRDTGALVFLETRSESGGILTGKIFEYISSGRPILGIGVVPESAVGGLFSGLEHAYALGEAPQAIAECIASLLQSRPVSCEGNLVAARKYSREALAHRMLTVMTDGAHG